MTLYLWDIVICLEDLRDSSRALAWAWTHGPSNVKNAVEHFSSSWFEKQWDFRLLWLGHCKSPTSNDLLISNALMLFKDSWGFNGGFISRSGGVSTCIYTQKSQLYHHITDRIYHFIQDITCLDKTYTISLSWPKTTNIRAPSAIPNYFQSRSHLKPWGKFRKEPAQGPCCRIAYCRLDTT